MHASDARMTALQARIDARRLDFEAGADALFDRTWASLRELAQPFRFELDLCRGPSGHWRDLYAQMPYRFMDLPLVLLDEFGLAEGTVRQQLELGLLEQSALSAAAIQALELVLEAEAHVGYEHVLLHSTLSTHAEWQLAALSVDLPAARTRALGAWNDAAAALLEHRRLRVGRCTPYRVDELPRLGRRWAPLKGAMACALEQAGRMALWPALEPLLDEAANLFQLGRELGRIARDLARGHYSLAIAQLLQRAGLSPAVDAPPDVNAVMLAAVLPQPAAGLAAEALARVEALGTAVRALGLPMLAHWLEPLAEPYLALRDQHAAVRAPTADPPPARTAHFVLSTEPQLKQVLAAARGFLSADPDYVEAWEEYRWGFLNLPMLTCKVFPIGLILDHRVATGESCAGEIDALFERYAHNRFHYFEQPSSLPPDGDTLGLMLGLAEHAGRRAHWRTLLQEPLGWLQANVEADGRLPVFLTRGVEAGDGRAYVPVGGQHCAAVQARLLRGLIAHDATRFRGLIRDAARSVLAQVVRARGGAHWHYPVVPGASLVLELCAALDRQGFGIDTAPAVGVCVELLRQHAALARRSSLDAALLWLAAGTCRAAEVLRDPVLIERLIRSQHPDGGWAAEALYHVPTRGNLMTGHGSRLLSSAYVYRALCDAEGRRRAAC
ncbi:MAG: hypothetical protein MUE46_06050 [Xanthomonadales bacterium]|jgi:hypothetical protein|nr:hypothetical protein [Xanthomonadales bacterium]